MNCSFYLLKNSLKFNRTIYPGASQGATMKKYINRLLREFSQYFLLPMLGFAMCISGCANKSGDETGYTLSAADQKMLDAKNPLSDIKSAIAAGKPLYTFNCLMCHGDGGKGDGMAGVSLTKPPADLTSQKVSALTDGRIFLTIKNGRMVNGKMTMPPARKMMDEEVWQIVAYVRSLQAIR